MRRAAGPRLSGKTGWWDTCPCSKSSAQTSLGKKKCAAWSPCRWPISRRPTRKANSPRRPGPALTPGHEVTSSTICWLAVRASVMFAIVRTRAPGSHGQLVLGPSVQALRYRRDDAQARGQPGRVVEHRRRPAQGARPEADGAGRRRRAREGPTRDERPARQGGNDRRRRPARRRRPEGARRAPEEALRRRRRGQGRRDRAAGRPSRRGGRGPARRRLRRRARRRLAHAHEVHDEDERLVGADDAAGAALAVGQVRRDRDAPPAADLHAGHALVPSGDDLALAELELEGVAAVPRGVELVARRPRDTHVVDLDDPAVDRLVAVADLDVLELELVGGRLVGGDFDLGLLVEGHARHGSRAAPSSARRRRSGARTFSATAQPVLASPWRTANLETGPSCRTRRSTGSPFARRSPTSLRGAR